MPIKVNMTGENPNLSVEVNRFGNGKVNYCTIKLGGSESQDTGALEIELDKSAYEELLEKMDFAYFDETKSDLEAKVEELELKISRLENGESTDGVGYFGKSA
jgi:hypothetical protein